MSQQTREVALNFVMAELGHRKEEIEHFLPSDLSYDKFTASVGQALRFNPQILDCKQTSIVTACMRAAYDGLRIDGREAALVEHKMRGKGSNQGQTAKMAQYFPMAFGLIQQIYRGGEVVAIETDVIYENDEYHVTRGTNPGIHHIPLMKGARGDIIGAYSVATLKGGYKTFEFLTGGDLAQIKAAAKTSFVWNAWPGEMSRKSAIRRHRKTLPLGNRDIIDVEEADIYSDDGVEDRLPAPAARAAQHRPTRRALADQSGSEGGTAMDLNDDSQMEAIEGQSSNKAKSTNSASGQAAAQQEQAGDRQDKGEPAEEQVVDQTPIPQGPEEWAAWKSTVEDALAKTKTVEGVTALQNEHKSVIEHADPDLARTMRNAFSDQRADLIASGEE